MVEHQDPERFKKLLAEAQHEVRQRYSVYEQLARSLAPAPAPQAGMPAASGKG